MNIKKVNTIYFSPTGGTEKIARLVAENIADKLSLKQEFYDFTVNAP